MKRITVITLFVLFLGFHANAAEAKEGESLFPTLKSKEEFAKETASLIAAAWEKWQDAVIISGVDVEGSRGMLLPGDIAEPVFTSSGIMATFKRTGRSQDYIDCVKAVADATEDGMRSWQRGYTNKNIPFPLGASCTITLPPCNNVPVMVASGESVGDKAMTEHALYSYMLYRTPRNEKDIKDVFKAAAKAIALCFSEWKDSCSIVGILATGGMAPSPAPMGTGPGPVRGAKGTGGKLVGAYFDGDRMYQRMVVHFKEEDPQKLDS